MLLRGSKAEIHKLQGKFGSILLMSVWGFVIVIASLLFSYAGLMIDQRFDTKPTFMLGLLVLALFLSVGRFYWEAWQKRNLH
jgi:uncharacterized membrane protein